MMSTPEKNATRAAWIFAAFGVLLALPGVYVASEIGLSARIPVHWDLSGVADRFAPAWIGLFVLPAGLVFLSPLLVRQPSAFSAAKRRKTFCILSLVVVALAAGQFVIIRQALRLAEV